jgi:hypothetical protein
LATRVFVQGFTNSSKAVTMESIVTGARKIPMSNAYSRLAYLLSGALLGASGMTSPVFAQ